LLNSKEVDCTDGTDPLIQKYSINGYPSVIILKDGQTVRFEGKVTKENLEQFVTGTLGPKKA
jgi:thioredoxin-like negative regulator of GroEL